MNVGRLAVETTRISRPRVGDQGFRVSQVVKIEGELEGQTLDDSHTVESRPLREPGQAQSSIFTRQSIVGVTRHGYRRAEALDTQALLAQCGTCRSTKNDNDDGGRQGRPNQTAAFHGLCPVIPSSPSAGHTVTDGLQSCFFAPPARARRSLGAPPMCNDS
jgi:hypothetical protein